MPIPKSVTVAGIEYTVTEEDGLLKMHNLMGQVRYADSAIEIDSSMSDSKKEQVFIHELLHAILMESGYEEQDEEMVNRVSITLHQVLKQNNLITVPNGNLTI